MKIQMVILVEDNIDIDDDNDGILDTDEESKRSQMDTYSIGNGDATQIYWS